jgi:hypothetical protein
VWLGKSPSRRHLPIASEIYPVRHLVSGVPLRGREAGPGMRHVVGSGADPAAPRHAASVSTSATISDQHSQTSPLLPHGDERDRLDDLVRAATAGCAGVLRSSASAASASPPLSTTRFNRVRASGCAGSAPSPRSSNCRTRIAPAVRPPFDNGRTEGRQRQNRTGPNQDRTHCHRCAARRSTIYPAKSGGTWRNVLGSDDLPRAERSAGDSSMSGNRRTPRRRPGWAAGGPA